MLKIFCTIDLRWWFSWLFPGLFSQVCVLFIWWFKCLIHGTLSSCYCIDQLIRLCLILVALGMCVTGFSQGTWCVQSTESLVKDCSTSVSFLPIALYNGAQSMIWAFFKCQSNMFGSCLNLTCNQVAHLLVQFPKQRMQRFVRIVPRKWVGLAFTTSVEHKSHKSRDSGWILQYTPWKSELFRKTQGRPWVWPPSHRMTLPPDPNKPSSRRSVSPKATII